MIKLSFVIPCYRSEKTIRTVVDSIRSTVATRDQYAYEIILVNDSSPDHVFDEITKIAAEDPNVKGIDLAKNFGQHAALMTGFRYVTGDIVICLDDDGQTPASEMFTLIDKLDEGNDVVFAKYKEKKHSFVRNFGSFVNDLMARTMIGKPKELSMMSYFCARRFVIDEVLRYQNPYPYVSGLLLRTSNKIVNAEVTHHERMEGTSGYTFGKLISLWLNGFTSFSIKPLRVATLIGSICAIGGFLYGGFVILNAIFKFLPGTPLGYSSTIALMVFLSGIMLLTMGMVGEYVGRIYISINNSPQTVVRTALNVEEEK